MKYFPKKIEDKWQKRWLKERTYEPDFLKAKRPFYNLMMFPYPSAEGLHIGGMRTFTGVDVYGRFMRMRGWDVFEPIGLDGFGIHSENYALKIGKHPIQHAKDSEKNFYRQLLMMGNGYAWNERLETYDPEYYHWTQWIFLQMYKRGLAYRKKAEVNWCPSCLTVIADEQVVAGECERCGSKVIKKDLEQWFFKITDYAEPLLRNLETIDWPEPIKIAQKNWIGKSEGAEIGFELKTKEKPNFVLLHGFGGSPDKNFFPWLKNELEKRGYKVQTPYLAHLDKKKTEEKSDMKSLWNQVVLDRNTVIVGHSLGAVVAMKALEKLENPVRKLVLAGGFIDPNFKDKPRIFAETFGWKFDFKKIKRNAGQVIILQDTNDSIIPGDQGVKLQEVLGGKLIEQPSREKHFCAEIEPLLLEHVLDVAKVFTTRPDTLFGATYLVLGPEHLFLKNNDLGIGNYAEVQSYIKEAKTKSDEDRIAAGKEKTGVELRGVKAINPANGKDVPVWVADYVLGNVGTGAIMAVPAHDERDFAFAKKFGLPIKNVIAPTCGEKQGHEIIKKSVISAVIDPRTNKVIVLNWGQRQARTGGYMLIGGTVHGGEDVETTARREIEEETGYTDLKLVRISDVPGYGYFYSNTKNHNVFTTATGLLFELQSEKKVPQKLDDGERGKFKVEWHPIERVENMLDDGIHKYFYRTLVLGGAYTEVGILVDSGNFTGMDSARAKWEITAFVGGERKVQYRLRDWLISRQRYWGPPIPMIFCEKCRWQPVPEKDLPVKLPHINDFRPKGTGESPLASEEKFYKVRCPKCKSWARRETDVSDTFLDSAWYYLGYLMAGEKWKPKFGDAKFKSLLKRWTPVDMYIGGAEHAVLHLLYVRFVAMALHDWGFVPFVEPFKKFRTHGLITKDGAKMSKSRGNVVNPDEYVGIYGADAIRMYLAFLAPLNQGGDFRDEGIKGITRFLERVWNLYEHYGSTSRKVVSGELNRQLHKTIKKVTKDIENFQYNTAISALMILLNTFEEKPDEISGEHLEKFLLLLAPMAPHITEELWQKYFAKSKKFYSVHHEPWPAYDQKLLQEESFELVIQINGRIRSKIELPIGVTEELAKEAALSIPLIREQTASLKKIIFVPNKLINFVL